MGRDKALLPFRGGTLVDQIRRTVLAAAGNVTLVGRPDLGGIPDLYPGEGPLGGILTALHHTHSSWNLIVACDLPNLDAAFLTHLLQVARASSADVVLPYDQAAHPQPLCAVYHRRALAALETAFAGGIRAVKSALLTLEVEPVTIAESELFQNVNTPEEWAAYDAK
jgi:molybdopterin-guanine dinucleotide biosynthesis protein A